MKVVVLFLESKWLSRYYRTDTAFAALLVESAWSPRHYWIDMAVALLQHRCGLCGGIFGIAKVSAFESN